MTMFDPHGREIPLGVECAWPLPLQVNVPGAMPRQRRLAEAWRRLKAVFQGNSRSNWAR
jgi:hypothetical protein